jgi:hypothetical protein
MMVFVASISELSMYNSGQTQAFSLRQMKRIFVLLEFWLTGVLRFVQ